MVYVGRLTLAAQTVGAWEDLNTVLCSVLTSHLVVLSTKSQGVPSGLVPVGVGDSVDISPMASTWGSQEGSAHWSTPVRWQEPLGC